MHLQHRRRLIAVGLVSAGLAACAAALPGLASAAASTTTKVSYGQNSSELANGASSRPSISADGRFIAFASTASNMIPLDQSGPSEIFIRDTANGSI
jgi:hypothetical protein